MPSTHPRRLRSRSALAAVVALALAIVSGTVPSATSVGAQDAPTTSTTFIPVVLTPDAEAPDDPAHDEGVDTGEVPIDEATVPPSNLGPGEVAEAALAIRRELEVAKSSASQRGSSYAAARDRTVNLEAQLDVIERAVTELAGADRAAVRRVESARHQFETRAIRATIRGRLDDYVPSISDGDPNEIAAARTLLAAVLDADERAIAAYQEARAATDADLLAVADQLVATRTELAEARAQMVDARRASVSAQLDLEVLAAGSDILIRGFVFPVGQPHSFSNSFGAPRMTGTEHEHSHQGTDILAPFGTPLLACERGIITKVSNSLLGGISFWLKGESGTYYYYAHLQSYADGFAKGNLVEAGSVLGYVGDTGNAKGTPHLHFEIHPNGGAAVNPYPLLKVVDQLSRASAAPGQ